MNIFPIALLVLGALSASCCRHVRVAEDITPGNFSCGEKFDWRYGATDIRIQTSKIMCTLMDRWYCKTANGQKPRILISEVDNRTDYYISTDMIRDIFEGVAANDCRFITVAGDSFDACELDARLNDISSNPKYNPNTAAGCNNVTAPKFLAKIRITKAKTAQPRYDIEDWRMQISLYDLETHEVVDSAWDVLEKKVYR